MLAKFSEFLVFICREGGLYKTIALVAFLFSNVSSQVCNVIENPQKILENYEE